MQDQTNITTPESKVGSVAFWLSLTFLFIFTIPAAFALGITAMSQNKKYKNTAYKQGRTAVIISSISIILFCALIVIAINSQTSSQLLTNQFLSIDSKISLYQQSTNAGDGYYPPSLNSKGVNLSPSDRHYMTDNRPVIGKIFYEPLPIGCTLNCQGYKLQATFSNNGSLIKTINP